MKRLLPLLPLLLVALPAVAGPLHDAVRKGDTASVKALLAGGADVDAKDANGQTPLLLAVKRGNVLLARILLGAGADANGTDNEGVTPMDLARAGKITELQLLLDKHGGAAGAGVTAPVPSGLGAADALAGTDAARRLAKGGAGVLPGLLKSGNPSVLTVVWALGSAAEPALVAAAEDGSPAVRAVAMRGLALLSNPTKERVAIVSRHLDDGPAGFLALSEMGTRHVVKGLSKRTKKRISEAIDEALQGNDEMLRRAAASALAALGNRTLSGGGVNFAKALKSRKSLRQWEVWSRSRRLVVPFGRARRAARFRNKQVRQSILRGLDWLARNQEEDGHWKVKVNLYDEGVAGLALLAFLGEGHADPFDPKRNPHAGAVKRVVKYLLAAQDKDGYIGYRKSPRFTWNLGVCTFALAELWALTGNPAFREPVERSLKLVYRARNPHLAWRYGLRSGENATAVTTWMAGAIRTAWLAGSAVDAAAMDGASRWVDKMTDPEFGQVGYNMPGGSPVRFEGLHDKFPVELSQSMTASGMFVRMLAGEDPRRSVLIKKGADLCLEKVPVWDPEGGHIDMYFWYFGSLVVQQCGPNHAKRWNEALWKGPRMAQTGAGSWEPIGAWCGEVGPAYATAMMVLCLEAPYLYDTRAR